mmetsp:Transcript_109223/g.308058  ORF Transcript_109223/g.308058 Transcript_109223/m.308058 type:complete len:201 (+) Transcript_109223:1692-2294(+)
MRVPMIRRTQPTAMELVMRATSFQGSTCCMPRFAVTLPGPKICAPGRRLLVPVEEEEAWLRGVIGGDVSPDAPAAMDRPCGVTPSEVMRAFNALRHCLTLRANSASLPLPRALPERALSNFSTRSWSCFLPFVERHFMTRSPCAHLKRSSKYLACACNSSGSIGFVPSLTKFISTPPLPSLISRTRSYCPGIGFCGGATR